MKRRQSSQILYLPDSVQTDCQLSVIGPSLFLLPILGILSKHVMSAPSMSFFPRSPQSILLQSFLPMTFTATFVVPV